MLFCKALVNEAALATSGNSGDTGQHALWNFAGHFFQVVRACVFDFKK